MGKIWEEAKQFRQELEERAGDVVWESEEEDMASRALEEEIEEKLASAAGEYGYAIKGVEMRGDPPGLLPPISSPFPSQEKFPRTVWQTAPAP